MLPSPRGSLLALGLLLACSSPSSSDNPKAGSSGSSSAGASGSAGADPSAGSAGQNPAGSAGSSGDPFAGQAGAGLAAGIAGRPSGGTSGHSSAGSAGTSAAAGTSSTGGQGGQSGEGGLGGESGEGGQGGEGGLGGVGGQGGEETGGQGGLGTAGEQSAGGGGSGQAGAGAGGQSGTGAAGQGGATGGIPGGQGGTGGSPWVANAVLQVASGSNETCVLRADHRVLCWGQGFSYSISDPAPLEPTFRLIEELENVETLSRNCAQRSDGSVWCWGGDYTGNEVVNLQVALVEGLPAQPHQLVREGPCVITDSNALWCWGDPFVLGGPQPNHYKGLFVRQVGPSSHHSCAILLDGNPVCWGANGDGELGNGETGGWTGIVPVATSLPLTEIILGHSHTCARVEDGTALCWGENFHAQVSIDQPLNQVLTPKPVPGLTGVVQLAPGGAYTCALTEQGGVSCWGSNEAGQLGDPSLGTGLAGVHEVPGLTEVVELSAGPGHACAVRKDGSLWCWGFNIVGQVGIGAAPMFVTSPVQVPIPAP
jgi:alpha-tubulin suppressor-like RCC1 family protein